MSEEQLQAQCYQWFWNSYPDERQMLFHVQQSAQNRIQGSRFKAIGVTKGVSDLVLLIKGQAIFIELKLEKGTQSPHQIEFESKVKERGFIYCMVRSIDEFKQLIKNYL